MSHDFGDLGVSGVNTVIGSIFTEEILESHLRGKLLPNFHNDRGSKELIPQIFVVICGDSILEDLHSFFLQKLVYLGRLNHRFLSAARAGTEGREK